MRISCFIVVALLLIATVTPLYAQSDSTSAPPDDTTLVGPTDQMPTVDGGDQVAVPIPLMFPALRTKATDCLSSGGLPDPACTPGALDPRVTQDNIASTICVSGYTATVRPSTTVTNRIKVKQMAAYGLQDQPLATNELDHLVPLELGGAPADVANLWPEPWTGDVNAHQKDTVETFLNREVCRGIIQLVDAQRMIATDWLEVYQHKAIPPGQ